MNGDDFTIQCVGCGLSVSRAGAITDDEYEYGFVKRKMVMTLNGTDAPLDDLSEICYREVEHSLILTYVDGSKITIEGRKHVPMSDSIAVMKQMLMPTCLMELDAIMDKLFPDIDEKLYFDVLNEQMAFFPDLFEICSDLPNRPMMFSDEHVPAYILCIQKRLFEHGYTGKRYPSKEMCLDALKLRAFRHQRNMFREWLESLRWDGLPRLRRWFIDGLGATAPPLEGMTLHGRPADQVYLESATEAWFMGAVRRQYAPTKSEVVPVLIGGEGMGKGNFLRYTAGYNDAWFIDTSASLEGPGAEQKFLEGIRGRIIVELSESSQFASPKGAELLKAFVSKTEDQSRKAYAAFQTTSVRRFSLIATSNQNAVFIDTGGGNRRYFPMYCDPALATLPFDPTYRQIGRGYMEQVWAEAMHIFRFSTGGDTFLTKEVAELASIMQRYGTRENPSVTMIDEWLNDPMNGYSDIGSLISRDLIFRDILCVEPSSGLLPKGAEVVYNVWSSIQKCWRKCPKPMRIGGKTSSCVYERICTPEDLLEKKRSNMVNVRPEEIPTFIDTVGIMRKLQFRHGFKKVGDFVPTDGLSGPEIQALLDKGYIYEGNIGAYYLAVMP